MGKGIYTNRIWVYGSIFIVLLGQAFWTARGNYLHPLLIYAAFGFIYLFYVEKSVLLFFILAAKMFLDSIPFLTYPKLSYGLSFMEYFTFGLMIFMVLYLLVYKGIVLDAISKSMAPLLVAMAITTAYHRNIADLIDLGSLWLYFILLYLLFKYLLYNMHINNVLNFIVITSLYPFLNQLYSVLIGVGRLHYGFVRYEGTFGHPNAVAEYLFIAIPASLYLLTVSNKLVRKYFYICVLALCHIGIFLASYRTIWIAVIIFWLFYVLFASRNKLVTVMVLAFVSIVAWYFIGEIFRSKLMPIKIILENPDPLTDIASHKYDKLLSARIGLWKGSLRAYLDSNLIEKLIGLGIGSTKRMHSIYMHSEYISALVETGIIGFATLLLWIYFVFRTLYYNLYHDKEYTCIVLGTFISFLVIAFGCMPFRSVLSINYISLFLASISNGRSG